jgi:hypothetical protein
MAILAVVSALLGAVLGLRFKVLILVPTVSIGLFVILGGGLVLHNSLTRVALAATLMATCLQVGYLAGIGIQAFLLWARISRRYQSVREARLPLTRSMS